MKCLIVDDEPIARLGMKRLIERHPDLEIAAMLASAEEAAEYLSDNSVDIIFLDIQMPGLTGIEFARRIPGTAMVIFTTAYSEYAIDSYEVDAVDYLVKPIDPARFDRAVEKARNYSRLLTSTTDDKEDSPVSSTPDLLVVKADRRYNRVRYSEILYIEGLKDYVILHLSDRNLITRISVKGIEDLLPSANFLRVNKSYIVNLDHIDSFDTNDIYIGDHAIAIGQTYRDAVLNHLLN